MKIEQITINFEPTGAIRSARASYIEVDEATGRITPVGTRRFSVADVDAALTSASVIAAMDELVEERRKLRDEVRAINDERDGLVAKVAALERVEPPAS